METGSSTIEAVLLEQLRNDPRIEVEIDGGTELVESGILDSLSILDLVVFVEERFDVVLTVDEITPDAFRTVAALADRIAART